jgi:hypothetical protein
MISRLFSSIDVIWQIPAHYYTGYFLPQSRYGFRRERPRNLLQEVTGRKRWL